MKEKKLIMKICNSLTTQERCLRKEVTINCHGREFIGTLIGGKQTFEAMQYFQYLVTKDCKVFKMFFELPQNHTEIVTYPYKEAYDMATVSQEEMELFQ